MQPTIYLVFGAQGSGKSTQGHLLAQKLQLPLFDSGEQLRHFAKQDTDLGQKVASQMGRGKLVSNEILHEIIKDFIQKNPITKGLVMDGFPRTVQNCDLLEKLASEYNWHITGVLIQISDQTVYDRLSIRAQTEGREDDQPEIITKRLSDYKSQTLPVIEWLKQHHQIIEINGEPSIEEVTKEMFTALQIHE